MAYTQYKSISTSAECRVNKYFKPRCNHQHCWNAYFTFHTGVTIAVYTIISSWGDRGREEVINKQGKKFLKFFEKFLKTTDISKIVEDYKAQQVALPNLHGILEGTDD